MRFNCVLNITSKREGEREVRLSNVEVLEVESLLAKEGRIVVEEERKANLRCAFVGKDYLHTDIT